MATIERSMRCEVRPSRRHNHVCHCIWPATPAELDAMLAEFDAFEIEGGLVQDEHTNPGECADCALWDKRTAEGHVHHSWMSAGGHIASSISTPNGYTPAQTICYQVECLAAARR